MLDIKFIRNNLSVVKEGARKKHIDVDLDKLVNLDDERLTLLHEIEELRTQQREAEEEFKSLQGKESKTPALEKLVGLKTQIKELKEKYGQILNDWKDLMLRVPNVPDISVPEGNDDQNNVEIKTFGDKPSFDFEPKDHIELMTNLNMVDLERGVKVHGFRGYFLTNDAVRLTFAIWNYALDFFGEKDFSPMLAPAIARKENFEGTGFLPNDAEDLYQTQDGDYLSGTAEVPVMGYFRDDVLSINDFPIKKLAFSPCFRREAGSYGKDIKGLIRVHEFYKWEQLLLCEANHEESVKWHEWLTRNTEEFIESLDIPYRTVINCGGDLGLGQVKKYDIELWVPKENIYREISSASYFHDFQTRRLNIRYKDIDGKMRFVHSLNNTAIPTPRILVSLVENFQDKDGNIIIPEKLRKYFGKDKIEK